MLSQELILRAFERLSDRLAERGVSGEIALLGGTAMMFAFHARQTTKDVDAIFVPAREIREAAKQVAADLGLHESWLNDGAKAFLSPTGQFSAEGIRQYPNLRVLTPTPEYMLAMKVLAARVSTPVDQGDKSDIALLIDHLKLQSAQEVMAIVSRYYADARLLPRSAYLVDEIFEDRSKRS
jgi:hypothetical protein